MYYVFIFLFGVVIGIIVKTILSSENKKLSGFIEVDDKNEKCRLVLSSDFLISEKTETASFKIVRGVSIEERENNI